MQRNTLTTNTKFYEIVSNPYDRYTSQSLVLIKGRGAVQQEGLHFESILRPSTIVKHPLNNRLAEWVREPGRVFSADKTNCK